MRGMGFRNKKSKEILTRLLVLYQHLDRLRSIQKPRSVEAKMMIEALYIRIEREKEKLRELPNE